MGTFKMNMETVHAEGGRISSLAEEFAINRRKIDEIVTRILSSDYTSDDGKAIANEIRSHEPMLNQIQARLEAHGNFGIRASKQTQMTTENIISGIK